MPVRTTTVQRGESLLGARARLEEESQLLQRIARSAPPIQSIEGRLQAWRDARDYGEVELETVWQGGEGLTSMGERRAR